MAATLKKQNGFGMVQLSRSMLAELRQQASREQRTIKVVLERAWELYKIRAPEDDLYAKVPKR